jgi:hypothetical protein
MVHEVAADEIMLVADAAARSAVRREEQARILDPPAGEHERACRDLEPPSAERGDSKAAHTIASALDVDDVRIQVYVDIRRCRQLVAVDHPEVAGIAELEHSRIEHVADDAETSTVTRQPRRMRVVERSEAADALCTLVIGLELRKRQRPTTVVDARTRLEVERIEWPALLPPARRRTAEHSEAGACRRIVRQPYVGAEIQQLRAMPEIETAAFEHGDTKAGPLQLRCKADPGRTGAHDADVCREFRGVDGASVMERHRADPARA